MTAADIRKIIDNVLHVLQPFLPLVNCHMVNFLSNDLWSNLVPADIRTEINAVGIDETLNYLINNGSGKEKLPAALQQYLQKAEEVSFQGVLKSDEFWASLENIWSKDVKPSPQLSMFMSPKKAHEVQKLTKVIAALAQINDLSCIIDLGGGKGYLGSTLAYHYGLQVLSIDCAQVNTHGALKLANNLKKWWDVMQEDSSHKHHQDLDKLYKQDTSFISPETNLGELVHKNFQSDEDQVKNLQRLCLVGLHACGDLTPSCIRLFCTNSDIRALCIVGCCYNLITEDSENISQCSGEAGFPMSLYLKNKGLHLGRNARMLAAQSVNRIAENGKPPPISLWYRALFQMLLIERNGKTDVHVGRSKASIKDFLEYASKALTKLRLPQATPEEVRSVEDKYKEWQKLHDIFFMLRVSLAPVIENLILLDRLLYLQDQGIEYTYLVQLFDSVISPRCCGIIAFKK